jgi:RNA polymerase sigma-70 factor (ECF subfamily)
MLTEDAATASDSSDKIGDGPPSFEDLFDAHRERLFQAMALLTGNRHEAEDIVQDAFVKILEHWDRVGTLDDPVGYLYRTAMNGFRSHFRRSKVALKKQLMARERDELAVAERHLDLTQRLSRLTSKQRVALILTDLLEFTSEEAGEVMGMRSGAVRMQASRARDELRRTEGDDHA